MLKLLIITIAKRRRRRRKDTDQEELSEDEIDGRSQLFYKYPSGKPVETIDLGNRERRQR